MRWLGVLLKHDQTPSMPYIIRKAFGSLVSVPPAPSYIDTQTAGQFSSVQLELELELN